jgi:hypothetical protein
MSMAQESTLTSFTLYCEGTSCNTNTTTTTTTTNNNNNNNNTITPPLFRLQLLSLFFSSTPF